MFSFDAGDCVKLKYNKYVVMDNICMMANVNGELVKCEQQDIHITDEYARISFANSEYGISAVLKIILLNESVKFNFQAGLFQQETYMPLKSVDEDSGYSISFSIPGCEKIVANYMQDSCWSYVKFDTVPDKTQNLLLKKENCHFCFTTLCTEMYKAQLKISDNGRFEMYMGSGCAGYTDVSGDVMVLGGSERPFLSIKHALDAARNSQMFQTPEKKDKNRPAILDGLGWCTWDACYFDVTEDKIIAKLNEFRDKSITVKWVLIDDGWFLYDKKRLQSIYCDKNKFPNGLGGTIHRIKNEYGIKQVGIWHSFNGYWFGIDEKSSVYYENADCFVKTKLGAILPDFYDWKNAFAFYDKWHTYLENEGIDFLKIDTQGELNKFAKDNVSAPFAVRNMQVAIEKSTKIHFNGNVINCMAMGIEHTQSRKYTNMLRNSDDFWPNRPESFKKHLLQNLYNAVFRDDLYYLDFDMWWSDNDFSIQSAVLRAVSGGPIYMSDEIGKSDPDIILPLVDDDGKTILCDQAAMPPEDELYTDYLTENRIVKAVNSIGEASVLAMFNVCEENIPLTDKVKYSDIKNKISDKYIAYFHFKKEYCIIDEASCADITLERNGVEIVTFLPVKDNCFYIGDTEKYIAAGKNMKKVCLDTVL